MAVQTTKLVFKIENQNPWFQGEAVQLKFDTGDLFVFDVDPISKPINVSAFGFGFSGTAYVDFKAGLVATLTLPNAGSWGASYNIDVNVGFTSGIDTGDTPFMAFDLSDWQIGDSRIASEGFNLKPTFNLDFVYEIAAGIRNFQYMASFIKSDAEDMIFTDGEGSENGVMKGKIAILELTFDSEQEIDLYEGFKLTIDLPSGADAEPELTGGAEVTAEGVGDSFLTLNVDLDQLVTTAGKESGEPVTVSISTFLEETVFAEHKYDLADYIFFLDREEAVFKATALDINATAGLGIAEKVTLDIGGGDTTADIKVTLTSDNGTAGDTSDDFSVSGHLGDTLNLKAPTSGFGTAVITATYQIENAQFRHDVGLGFNMSLNFVAIEAAIEGPLLEEYLAALSFGPLLEEQFPKNGLAASLYFFHTSYDATAAFTTLTDTYEVFYTDAPHLAGTVKAPMRSRPSTSSGKHLARTWRQPPTRFQTSIPTLKPKSSSAPATRTGPGSTTPPSSGMVPSTASSSMTGRGSKTYWLSALRRSCRFPAAGCRSSSTEFDPQAGIVPVIAGGAVNTQSSVSAKESLMRAVGNFDLEHEYIFGTGSSSKFMTNLWRPGDHWRQWR